MATAETVQLSEAHPPKHEAIKAFEQILPEFKRELIKLRHDHDKHEKQYFEAVSHLSDIDLTSFTKDDLREVRAGSTAYGVIIFGKVKIPSLQPRGPSCIFVRFFDAGKDEPAKFHSIHTEESGPAGADEGATGARFRAVFPESEPLEWFDT